MPTQYTSESLYVAIDIGKNVHCFGGYAGLDLRPLGPPQTVPSNLTGYTIFATWLTQQLANGGHDVVLVGLEPTSCYHEPWAYAIVRDWGSQLSLQFVNPYQTKQQRQQRQLGRRHKSDAVDVKAIAHCLRDGLGQPVRLPRKRSFYFGVWAATFRRVHRAKQRLQAQLLAQMDRLWPGALINVSAFRQAHPDLPLPRPLVLSRPLERRLIQILLTAAPDPHDWLTRSTDEIQISATMACAVAP